MSAIHAGEHELPEERAAEFQMSLTLVAVARPGGDH